MKVIGYVRVSTEEQAKEGVSLDSQRKKIELYAEMNDMELVGIVADEGISAKSLHRPGVQRVLETARKKEVDGIVIYKLDRIFRNTIDALNTARELEKKGVALHSITEKLDTKSAFGKFFFTLLASLAEMERNQIGERTSAAMQYKKSQGENTGNVPFGYRLQADGVHIEADALEQEIKSRMQELKAAGFSLRAVADELNRQGFTTRRGTAWSHVYVHSILKKAA